MSTPLILKFLFKYLSNYLTNAYLLYLTVNPMGAGATSALLTLYLLNLTVLLIHLEKWSLIDRQHSPSIQPIPELKS